MNPTDHETDLEARINERQRLETEARAAARAAFLDERIAAMPKRERPTKDEAADLGRRLLEVLDDADRKLGPPGSLSLAMFTTRKGTDSNGAIIHRAWPDEVDHFAAMKTAHGRMVRAEIDTACRSVTGTTTPPQTMRELATMPAAVLPPGAFARIVLALAWPGVLEAWKNARGTGMRRGPLAPDVMRRLGSKVPLTKESANVQVFGSPARVSVTIKNNAGRIDLFQPELVEAKSAEDAFLAMTKVLGPRATRTLWTCIDAVQRMEPDIRKATGDFLYTPGAFADVQRPRREKVRRHDARVLAALDDDMRQLAQTSVEWTIKAGAKNWTWKAALVVYQQATLTQGKRAKEVLADTYGPTRTTRTKGRRPAELWRINKVLLDMMKTNGAFFTWDPAVLRCSPEAVTLYLELAAHARRNTQNKAPVRMVDTLVRDTGIVRPDPHNPGRVRARLEQLLQELDAAGVLFGRLDGERLRYRLPEPHAKMLAQIPPKWLAAPRPPKPPKPPRG